MLLNFPHLVKKLRVESVGNAIAVGVALLDEVNAPRPLTTLVIPPRPFIPPCSLGAAECRASSRM
jgi:hypothetical protein